jgi:hypothetical protein
LIVLGILVPLIIGGVALFNNQSGQLEDVYGGDVGPRTPQPASNAIDFDEIVNNATLDANWTINGVYGIQSSASIQIDNGVSISGTFEGSGLADCDTPTTSKLLWDATGKIFSCGTDTNTTYTGGDNLTLTGTDFDVDDPFSVTTLTGTHVSASGDFTAPSGDITSLSATTITGAGLSDCDNATDSKLLYSDTGLFSCGTDEAGEAGAATPHSILDSDWHKDALLASVSGGSLIIGGETTWQELTIGASQSFLMSDGTSASWFDYQDLNTTYTGGDHLTLTGTDFDVDDDFLLNTGDSGTYASMTVGFSSVEANIASLSADTYWGAGLADCDTAATSKLLYSDTGLFSCGTDTNTTYTAGDMLTLTGTDFDIDDPFTVVTLTGTHVSASGDFTTPSGDITSLSAATINFPNDSVAEEDIDFNTACAAGSHYYLNGNDLACETDDNTTYTGGDNLTLTGTDFDVDDPFTVVTLTGTHVSASDDLTVAGVIALRTGGTLTSTNVCVADGTTGAIDCNLPQDGTTDCAAGSVCTGGHTHAGVNEAYAAGWNADTDAPEKDDVYDWGHVFDTDDDGYVNVLDSIALATAIQASGAYESDSTVSVSGAINFFNIPNCNTIDTDANGLLACGTDATSAGGTEAHGLLNSEIHTDTTLASTSAGSLIIGGETTWQEYVVGASSSFLMTDGTSVAWNDIAGALAVGGAITEGGTAVLNNDEMDASSELLNIFDDETGTGVIVFATSPQFTTSFTTAGAFAISPAGALTIGDGGDTTALNSTDWDIDATGIMTGIGAITADGLFTGTHASMSGDLDIVGDINVASVSALAFYGTITGDLVCTDCLNATEIEDIYLLDDGDVGTGVYDFGGTTGFEIMNAADPTVDLVGEIAIDSTDGQITWFGLDQATLIATQSFSFAISSTAFDLSTIMIKKASDPMTITGIDCIVKSATSINFQLVEGDANGANGVVVDAEIVAAATNTSDDGALTNAAIDATDWLLASVSQASGECDVLSCTIYFKWTEI